MASQLHGAPAPGEPGDNSSTGAQSVAGARSVAAAKGTLRQQAKRRRSELKPEAVEAFNHALCAALQAFLATLVSSRQSGPLWTLTYSALPGEPNLSGLPRSGVSPLALTRTPTEGHTLSIHPFESSLERHRYGFDQPVAGSDIVPDDQVGVVLVPGLAFDAAGGRLGFGAGYYDRLLGRLLSAAGEQPLVIVGISDGFVLDTVPTDSHDVVMTHIATSDGVLSISDWNQGKSAY